MSHTSRPRYNPLLIECRICLRSFRNRSGLTQHLHSAHRRLDEPQGPVQNEVHDMIAPGNMVVDEEGEMDDRYDLEDNELQPREPQLAAVGRDCPGALKATHPLLHGNVYFLLRYVPAVTVC